MDVLEAVEDETLESHSRGPGFECYAMSAHQKTSRYGLFYFWGSSASQYVLTIASRTARYFLFHLCDLYNVLITCCAFH